MSEVVPQARDPVPRRTGKRRRDGLWLDDRTPGKPVWCIRYKGLDGKPHRERTDAQTREQALAILSQKTTEILKARLVGVHNLEALKPRTFEAFIRDEYLPHCKATHTPSTYTRDGSLSRAVMPTFGRMVLRTITPGDLQRYVDRRIGGKGIRTKQPVKPATVNRELMFIAGALSEAVRRGYLDRNPAQGIPQLPEHNERNRWLTADEERTVLAFTPEYLKPIVLTAIHSGMRQGEILSLRWPDVDFSQRLVRVGHSKNHRVRYIPMNASLQEVLGSVERFVGPNGPSPYVFTNPATGTRWKDVAHAFAAVADKAGLPDVTFHVLRHTFGSRLAQAGVPLPAIRELMGHGTMTMTLRYAHLAPSNLRDAVNVLAGPSVSAERTRRVQASAAPVVPSALSAVPARKSLQASS